MARLSWRSIFLLFVVTTFGANLAACLAAQESIQAVPTALGLQAEQKIAELAARQLILGFLADEKDTEKPRKIVVKNDGELGAIQGTIEAIDAKKKLKIKVEELQVALGNASAQVIMQNPFRFDGKLKPSDSESISVSGVADSKVTLAITATFQELGGELMIRAKVEKIEQEIKELRQVAPPELKNAKQLIEEVFRASKDQLLKDINQWLEEESIKPKN